MCEVSETELRLLQLTLHGGSGLELPSLSWRRSSRPPSRPSLLFSFPSSSPVRIVRNLCLTSNSPIRIATVKKKTCRRNAHLLILVGEKSLENLTVGNNWVPAHPGHPALQSLHAHLNKLLLKASWDTPDTDGRFIIIFFFFTLCATQSQAMWDAHRSLVCLVKRGLELLNQTCPVISRTASQSACICD